MKVKELIEMLKECDQNAGVEFSIEWDNPFNSKAVIDILEIRYPLTAMSPVVVLRG